MVGHGAWSCLGQGGAGRLSVRSLGGLVRPHVCSWHVNRSIHPLFMNQAGFGHAHMCPLTRANTHTHTHTHTEPERPQWVRPRVWHGSLPGQCLPPRTGAHSASCSGTCVPPPACWTRTCWKPGHRHPNMGTHQLTPAPPPLVPLTPAPADQHTALAPLGIPLSLVLVHAHHPPTHRPIQIALLETQALTCCTIVSSTCSGLPAAILATSRPCGRHASLRSRLSGTECRRFSTCGHNWMRGEEGGEGDGTG